ncbi:hypothetical protein KQI63_10765 [bacterium]|nr:hypothetical protein [bacterium]
MTAKTRLSASLQRLLKRSEEAVESPSTDWSVWFHEPRVKKGYFRLHRGGHETYVSQVLGVREVEEQLVLKADALLPMPEESFWNEPVTLHGEIRTFDAGIEEIVTFTAAVGDRVEFDGKPAVELTDLLDLKRTTQEYVAELSDAFSIELGLIWFGEWIEVHPSSMTVSRLFFDAELEGSIGEDGYAVPKASLRLEHGSPEIPVRMTIKRLRGGGFEGVIEKLDSLARQKVTAMVEEIWRIAAGLSQRKVKTEHSDVGYRSTSHDALASAFQPHIVLLGQDERWATLISQKGVLRQVEDDSLEAVSEAVAEARCDLIIGNLDQYGDKAIRVERLLRSVTKFRDIPRIWFTTVPPAVDLIAENDTSLQTGENGEPESLDLVDFGAFDLVSRKMKDSEIDRRIVWALGGTEIGKGSRCLLISQEGRLRYRIGLALSKAGFTFTSFNRLEGLVPLLEKQRPKWVLLDAVSFEVEMEALLSRATTWAHANKADVIVLSRGAKEEQIRSWLKNGASDIVLLDPSLRQAAYRLTIRMQGERS